MGRGKSERTLKLLGTIKSILRKICPAGVRQLCYQLFPRHIESMSTRDTKRISFITTRAREDKIIPWGWITDETREPERISTWNDPDQILACAARSYRKDFWSTQPHRVEVWSEKGTIRGCLKPILDKYGVTFRVMHGFGSATAVHEAAVESRASKAPWHVFYVGDWDSSGMYMSEKDLPERLDRYGAKIKLERIALLERDTGKLGDLYSFDLYSKKDDGRREWFKDRYGRKCWELDAINPRTLRRRVQQAIQREIDQAAWDRMEMCQAAERCSLKMVLGGWKSIVGPVPK